MFSRRLAITLGSALFILIGTILVIQFGKGYRPTRQGTVRGTGLLAANSFPNGAQVYIDDALVTATDNTINLDPGRYKVTIKKDGFIPWEKNIRIEKELVAQTNATLFPLAPTLSPLTFTGAKHIIPSPDGTKLAFFTATPSAETKNGLYVLELNDSLLSLQRAPKQVLQVPMSAKLDKAQFVWSPDSTQILLSLGGKHYLLEASKLTSLANLADITATLPRVFSEWEEILYKRERAMLEKFPLQIQQLATASAKNVFFAPNEERMLYTYTATASTSLPDNLIPPVPASNTQPQMRELSTGKIYV